MTIAVLKHFDILNYVNKAQESATKGDVRESELRLQKEIEILKRDLEIQIATLKQSSFKFIVYTGISVCLYLTGAMYTLIRLMPH